MLSPRFPPLPPWVQMRMLSTSDFDGCTQVPQHGLGRRRLAPATRRGQACDISTGYDSDDSPPIGKINVCSGAENQYSLQKFGDDVADQ